MKMILYSFVPLNSCLNSTFTPCPFNGPGLSSGIVPEKGPDRHLALPAHTYHTTLGGDFVLWFGLGGVGVLVWFVGGVSLFFLGCGVE